MKELENLEKRLAQIQKEIETLKQGKPEFEKDCWYTGYDVIAKYSQLGGGNYGISRGIWSNDLNMSVPSAWRKSTPTEIQEAIEKEAVKRGFVEGAKCVWDGGIIYIKSPFRLTHYGLETNEGFIIMDNKGQWATVIKEQPLMIGGYEIVIHPRAEETTIDGHVFTKMFWEHALIVSTHSKAAVYVGCSAKDGGANKWVADEKLITKILKKLK